MSGIKAFQGDSYSNTVDKTRNGTRIVKPGQDLDKNAFLRILSAELSNQDPTNAKDGTEFVAQMAQFAGLEQMSNLNTTMRTSGAVSYINKLVMLNQTDSYGNLYYGQVRGVSRDGSSIKLNVVVGQYTDDVGNVYDAVKKFNVDDVLEVGEMPKATEEDGEEVNLNTRIIKKSEIESEEYDLKERKKV